MALETLLRAFRRGDLSTEQKLEATKRGALLIQHDLPTWAELVNAGVMWTVGQAAATAAVTALPTTTAGISLYNNEPEGGKSFILHSVFANQVANAAAQASWGLAHCVNVGKPATLPTADIAVTSIKGMKARQGNYGGYAIVDLAATVTDDLWKPVGGSVGTVVVSLGGTQVDVFLDGLVILPPGGMYSLQAVASAVDITARMGFRWAEVQL